MLSDQCYPNYAIQVELNIITIPVMRRTSMVYSKFVTAETSAQCLFNNVEKVNCTHFFLLLQAL